MIRRFLAWLRWSLTGAEWNTGRLTITYKDWRKYEQIGLCNVFRDIR